MKQKFLLKAMLLLFALIAGSSSVWADYEAVYTFTIAKSTTNSAYADTYDVTIDGLNWNVPGNHYADGALRIGGKNFEDEDRVITGKSPFTEAISKITFNHGGVSSNNLTVNSVTLTVASNDDYTDIIDEVVLTPTIAKTTDGSFDFVPSSPLTQWATNCYYKITINCTCTDTSSNRFLLVKSIVFFANKTATTTAITSTGITNTDLKDGTAAGSLSASVTAGGSPVAGATVSWESSDTDVATISETGVVTLVAVGTATLTATYAGDATYYGSSDTYNITVTDTRIATVTTIDDSDITNTDVYASTDAGRLTASVTAGGSPVAGAIVTWTSSEPTVATIDTEGNITLVKAGTTTITASYVGAGAYIPSFDTYDLTVTDSSTPLLYESVSKYTSSSDSSTKISNSNKATYLDAPEIWDAENFSNAYAGKNGCFKLGTSSATGTIKTQEIALTGTGKLTFQAKKYGSGTETGPLNVTVTGATATGDVSVTGTGDFVEYTVYLNNASGSVVITFATASKRIYLDEIKLFKTDAITITPANTYTTLTSAYALDFTNVSGLEAYIATSVSDKKVQMTQVNKVPANTGLVLKKTGSAASYNVPVFDGTGADDVEDNKMVGSATTTTDVAENEGYILSNGAFHPASEGTLPAGKAYLKISVSAPVLSLGFEGDDTTGVETLNVERGTLNDNSYYNLAGQRVAQPTKGLYIVNGKKVIIK